MVLHLGAPSWVGFPTCCMSVGILGVVTGLATSLCGLACFWAPGGAGNPSALDLILSHILGSSLFRACLEVACSPITQTVLKESLGTAVAHPKCSGHRKRTSILEPQMSLSFMGHSPCGPDRSDRACATEK